MQTIICFSLDPTAYKKGVGCGRFLNHSFKKPNLRTKVLQYWDEDNKQWYPRVIFLAIHFIPKGTELRWNYGDLQPALLEQPGMEWMLTE